MLTALDIRKIQCLDGLHYSFQMLRHYYADLWDTCCKIPTDNSKAIPALASCWGFIDALHRIREIAQSVPGLNVKHPEMRAFLSTSFLAEDYRHYIQHLRGELAKSQPNSFPVWGTLSWADNNKSERAHMAILGAQIEGTKYSGCVYDNFKKEWVSKVCLSVNGTAFNFDPIFASALRFEVFILPLLIDGASDFVQFHEKLPLVTFDFIFKPRN